MMLLDYYTSRELGKNADVVFCNFPSSIANAELSHAYIDRQLLKTLGIFKTENENGERTRYSTNDSQVQLLTDHFLHTEHQCFRELNLHPTPTILLGLSFYMGIYASVLHGLGIKWS